MPIGFLGPVAILAIATAAAVAPMRPRRTRRMSLAYLLGFLVNEAPFLAAFWLVAEVALAARRGDLETRAGMVALAVALVVLAGLAVVVARATRARPTLEGALADGLGAAWREDLEPGASAGGRRRAPLARILLWPFPTAGPGVERIGGLRYGGGRRHRLDVHRPRSRPACAPTLVYLHGGAFRTGSRRRQARPLVHRLAARGWVCVSADYTLRRDARFPDHLVDVKRVLAWVGREGRAYGADPDRVVIVGSSAGGNLAAAAGLTAGDPRFQPGFEDADTSVRGVVCLGGYFGGYGRPSRDGSPSSPNAYVRRDAPAFLVVHGALDTIVRPADARDFARRLRSVSTAPVVHAELPGGRHSFDLVHSIRFAAVVDAVEGFAGWVTSPRRSPARPAGSATASVGRP